MSIYALWSAYKVYKIKPESAKIGVALLTIIFNPIVPLSCSSEMWLFFDFITILVLSHFILSKDYYTNVWFCIYKCIILYDTKGIQT